jgi:hypothetical protein
LETGKAERSFVMSWASVGTRDEALELLEGYSEERKAELGLHRTRRPLVKSYLLETVPSKQVQPDLKKIFGRQGYVLMPLDETLFKIYDEPKGKYIGLLEKLLPRYPVIYSCDETKVMDPWVRRLVDSNPTLDRVWLSGRTFEELLKVVLRLTPGHRFGRLVFRHVNFFEGDPGLAPDDGPETDEPQGATDDAEEDLDESNADRDEDETYVPERRDTRFTIIDRLNVIKEKLPKMREYYNPLHAICQLRFPARGGTGGHDFYHDGKVTNRSDSFSDHRQHLQFVLGVYDRATEATERAAWFGTKQTKIMTGAEENVLVGAPVLLEFAEPLPQETFENFIESTFRRKQNKFRLWGNPIRLGPRKVHVYGLDRHLWQPLFLEITDRQIVVIVPYGTCGNSIHRLVTNVQQYLDPGVRVWVGDQPYADLIGVNSSIGGFSWQLNSPS